MSPKSLVALLLVGLCAAQMASAFRHSREVEQLLEAAEVKLEGALDETKDASRSSMEVVLGYMKDLEANVLRMANDKLAALGFPVDLVMIAELMKSNINSCVTNDAVKATADGIVNNMSTCVSSDVDRLKTLVKNMHNLWSTASNLPGSMMNVASQCSEHGEHDIPENALEVPPKDESNHDLAPVANEIMEETALTRNKRWLWGLGRITRCVKSVYSLARNDLITLPGQILATASDGYNIYKSAANSADIPKCVEKKITEILPTLQTLAYDVSTCLATLDVDAIMAANPRLAGLKTTMDLALKLGSMPGNALGAAGGAVGNVLGAISGGAGGAASGAVGNVLGALSGAAGATGEGAAPGGIASRLLG